MKKTLLMLVFASVLFSCGSGASKAESQDSTQVTQDTTSVTVVESDTTTVKK